MSERKPHSRSSIYIEPGREFTISPDLGNPIGHYDHHVLLDVIGLEIEGIGHGEIKILETTPTFDTDLPVHYLAGVQSPLTATVEFCLQSPELLETFKFRFNRLGEEYEADLELDEVELERGMAILRGFHWIDVKEQKMCEVVMPEDGINNIRWWIEI